MTDLETDTDPDSISTGDSSPNLKHRLVGAIIFVLIGVVVLPVILNGGVNSVSSTINSPYTGENQVSSAEQSPREIADLGMQTESDTSTKWQTVRDPAALGTPASRKKSQHKKLVISTIRTATRPARPTAPAVIQPLPDTVSDPVAENQSAGLRLQIIEPGKPPRDIDAPSTNKNTSSAAVVAPEKTREPAPAFDRGWVVRIGTFAVQENAEKIVSQLAAAGFSAQTTVIKSEKSVVTRVWIGPFRDRVTAARRRSEIERTTEERGFIASYP